MNSLDEPSVRQQTEHSVDVVVWGPTSYLWRFAGDRRAYLLFARASLLQNMHPKVGIAITQHSTYAADPWDRLIRTFNGIMQTIYSEDPEAAGRHIMAAHKAIKGTDPAGKRYHALDPAVYFWVHATLTDAVITSIDMFDHRLTTAEKEAIYGECKQWYSIYGVSDREMPTSWSDFEAYWHHMLEDVLECTPAAAELLDLINHAHQLPAPLRLPQPAWRTLSPLPMREYRKLVLGTLPQRARQLMGIPWDPPKELGFRLRAEFIRRTWRLAPLPIRYTPVAAAGWQRANRLQPVG